MPKKLVPEEPKQQKGPPSDEITWVLAIININRTVHYGHYRKFEEDYIPEVRKILTYNQPTVIRVQERYAYLLEPYLHARAKLEYTELEDLRTWEFYDRIEAIRKTEEWQNGAGWLKDAPQAYSDLYNPIVMNKLFWVREAARSNPFNTKYFMWYDSGVCNSGVSAAQMPRLTRRMKAMMADSRFFITCDPYPDGGEIHGCDRKLHQKFCQGAHTMFVCKGAVFGGDRDLIERYTEAYHDTITRTLAEKCLGTEETIFSILRYTHPHLTNWFRSSMDESPFDTWMCAFFHDDFPGHKRYNYTTTD